MLGALTEEIELVEFEMLVEEVDKTELEEDVEEDVEDDIEEIGEEDELRENVVVDDEEVVVAVDVVRVRRSPADATMMIMTTTATITAARLMAFLKLNSRFWLTTLVYLIFQKD